VQKTTAHRVAWLPSGDGVVTTARDGTTRVWPLRQAPDATEEELRELIQIRTQKQIGKGATLNAFTVEDWNTRREQAIASGLMLSENDSADKQEGMPKLVPSIDDDLLHEHRARDAEQDRDWFGAQWHLDRLIDSCQRDDESSKNKARRWILFTRRARTHSERGDLDAAMADYASARDLLDKGNEDKQTDWYRHRAIDCLSNGNLNLCIWYLDQVIVIDATDWQDYAMRAECHKRLKNTESQQADEEKAFALADDPLYFARP
jgi:tetratricopeptide (TPR) repeat protein